MITLLLQILHGHHILGLSDVPQRVDGVPQVHDDRREGHLVRGHEGDVDGHGVVDEVPDVGCHVRGEGVGHEAHEGQPEDLFELVLKSTNISDDDLS